MIKGFRDFIMRGNVVDLAVAVIIGAAFGAVVKRICATRRSRADPVLIVAAAIYFVIVGPMAHFSERYGKAADAETPAPSDEARLLTEIRDLLAEQPRA